jgi:hypothetical protein
VETVAAASTMSLVDKVKVMKAMLPPSTIKQLQTSWV